MLGDAFDSKYLSLIFSVLEEYLTQNIMIKNTCPTHIIRNYHLNKKFFHLQSGKSLIHWKNWTGLSMMKKIKY